jgi:hypothetical protein
MFKDARSVLVVLDDRSIPWVTTTMYIQSLNRSDHSVFAAFLLRHSQSLRAKFSI